MKLGWATSKSNTLILILFLWPRLQILRNLERVRGVRREFFPSNPQYLIAHQITKQHFLVAHPAINPSTGIISPPQSTSCFVIFKFSAAAAVALSTLLLSKAKPRVQFGDLNFHSVSKPLIKSFYSLNHISFLVSPLPSEQFVLKHKRKLLNAERKMDGNHY